MTKEKLAIAIDGPAAAGKSTVAKKVAHALKYIYIDTGAMYRALTYIALETHVDTNNEEQLYQLLLTSTIKLVQSKTGQKVYINDQDVTESIRNQHVTNHVSQVAKHRMVREEMVKRQRQLATKRGVVMDGRDIGTHVIPDAEVKFFLKASVDERAKRRYAENKAKGFTTNLEQLKLEISNRDKLDSEREVSPLIQANDAIVIDTTALNINQVTKKILDIIKTRGER
ncbi:(d)CMP kinase [Amphibacillus cookii]|uniref:(d)CMP kinase n=1 Tax=Amphibacillus cookii TaxID=767787 RepID=UPI001956B8B6|nr:(d)CMP kinase [Amphibacillus cookii]MBM7542502.1 cytidylate kinase [Amphibacillus cookii]